MSPAGLTKDAGWEIGVSRTVPLAPEDVWRRLTGPRAVRAWLGAGVRFPLERGDHYETADGTTGEIRSFKPLDRVRLTWRPKGWDHDTTVQVAISKTATGTTVRFHQERMASADERERQRAHWKAILDALF